MFVSMAMQAGYSTIVLKTKTAGYLLQGIYVVVGAGLRANEGKYVEYR